MSRWTTLALLSLAVPALADRPRTPAGHAQRSESDSGLSPEDEKAVRDYRLNKDNVAKLVDAAKRLAEVQRKDPALRKEAEASEHKPFDENAKTMARYPQVMAALKSAGLSPKEYFVGSHALFSAAVFGAMKGSNPDIAIPPYVNPENLKFLSAHPEVAGQVQGMFKEDRDDGEKGGRSRGRSKDKVEEDSEDRDGDQPAEKEGKHGKED